MTDTVISDAHRYPQDEGLPNLTDGTSETIDSAGSVMALAQAVDSDSYVRSDSELTFAGHDGTNDQVDVTAGIAYLDLAGETVTVQSGIGKDNFSSPPAYDTTLPTLPAIMVVVPTTVANLSVASASTNDVWLAYATDGTVTGVSTGDVWLRHGSGLTAPPHPNVKVGTVNPDDSTADVLTNRGPSMDTLAVGKLNRTVRVRESDDLQAAINNATDGDTIVIDMGPNGQHDVSSTVIVDKRLFLDFRNKLVPTGDFPAMKTTDVVVISGRGYGIRCFDDVSGNLTLDSTNLVEFKAKVYTQGIVEADLRQNGAACFALLQDDTEGSDNLNHSRWALAAQLPGRDGIYMENVGASSVNINAMRDCWALCNLNTGARDGLRIEDGMRNMIYGSTAGGDGRGFTDNSSLGRNVFFWDWENVSDPTGPITSNVWQLNGAGWYAKSYTANATAGIESVAFCTSGITLTLPNAESGDGGLVYTVVGQTGDESTNNITIQDSGDGAGGTGTFPFTISKDYGSVQFYRRSGEDNWKPNLGGT